MRGEICPWKDLNSSGGASQRACQDQTNHVATLQAFAMTLNLTPSLKAKVDVTVSGESASMVINLEHDDGNKASDLASRDSPRLAVKKHVATDVSWGATEDLLYAAQIIDFVVKQETGKMDEVKGGMWNIWIIWFRTSLLSQARLFKNGSFKNIKPNENVKKMFNLMIGSPLSTPIEKEILRRGLKIFLEIQSRYEKGDTELSRFHSILVSGIYSDKVFVIFDADRCGLKLPEFPSNGWSFVWVDKNGQNETYRIGQDWRVTRRSGRHVPKIKKMRKAAVPSRGLEVGTTLKNEPQQTRRTRKKGKQPTSTVPASRSDGTSLKSNNGQMLRDLLDKTPTMESFLTSSWAEQSLKLTQEDVTARAEQLGRDLGRKATARETMISICLKELAKDVVAMSLEDPELAQRLEETARRLVWEKQCEHGQAEDPEDEDSKDQEGPSV